MSAVRRLAALMCRASAFVIAGTAAALASNTLPTGGQFVAGTGSISSTGGSLIIDQSSPRGIIEWQSFSIGAGHSVQINNGNGVTLNRVTGDDRSQVMGSLSATGTIYLINAQGVVVGPQGVVTTGRKQDPSAE